jgi:hypothetical protein
VGDDPANAGQKQAHKRNQAGQFKAGSSGNPRGKLPGTRHRSTLILEALIDDAGPKLVRRAIKMAMDGDAGIMRALLALLLPPRRDRLRILPMRSACKESVCCAL